MFAAGQGVLTGENDDPKEVKTMKKLLSALLALLMLASCAAFAEESPTVVYVSISDDTGALVLAYAPVTVTDADEDGVLSICDALAAAHAANHPDGAEAFAAVTSEWGLSMAKLWGVENGGSYGYYLNDASAWSLVDPISAGDHVKAYAYTDLTAWSDSYCFFAAPAVEAKVNTEVALTLSAAGYDENWAPITVAVAGAAITVNGEKTETVTDENGNAVLTFAQAGVYTVSAVSESQTLVPPVCIVTVTE